MITTVSGALNGKVCIPPSKSVAHRMLICAALSDTPCSIGCSQENLDMQATASCLNALGANITYSGGIYSVTPISKTGVRRGQVLDCGESGSTLRFLLPVAAALSADARFTGHGRLPQRPLSPLYEEMTRHGISMSENGKMPLECHGKLPGGTYTLDAGVSSQFISGLLMALPLTGEESRIILTGKIESESYIGLTLNVLSKFGIKAERTADGFLIPAGQHFQAQPLMQVEGDWSGAAFWAVAGVAGTGAVECSGADYAGSAQGDRRIVDILRHMGGDIQTHRNSFTANPSRLTGCTIDCAHVPDLVPVLAVAASKAQGTTRFENIGRLRIKESDRVQAILDMLRGAGISCSATQNDLIVTGGTAHGMTYNPANDHRMAMAAAILATAHGISVSIMDSGCTAKSYPTFFNALTTLGATITACKE